MDIALKRTKKKYPDADKARSARRYAENPEYFKAKAALWQKANPAGSRTKAAERRALLQRRKCACCIPAEFKAVYAQATILGCEVDHTIPLCIGGLHCAKNLQLLTPEVHARKTRADIAEFRAF